MPAFSHLIQNEINLANVINHHSKSASSDYGVDDDEKYHQSSLDSQSIRSRRANSSVIDLLGDDLDDFDVNRARRNLSQLALSERDEDEYSTDEDGDDLLDTKREREPGALSKLTEATTETSEEDSSSDDSLLDDFVPQTPTPNTALSVPKPVAVSILQKMKSRSKAKKKNKHSHKNKKKHSKQKQEKKAHDMMISQFSSAPTIQFVDPNEAQPPMAFLPNIQIKSVSANNNETIPDLPLSPTEGNYGNNLGSPSATPTPSLPPIPTGHTPQNSITQIEIKIPQTMPRTPTTPQSSLVLKKQTSDSSQSGMTDMTLQTSTRQRQSIISISQAITKNYWE
eukprot:251732_1